VSKRESHAESAASQRSYALSRRSESSSLRHSGNDSWRPSLGYSDELMSTASRAKTALSAGVMISRVQSAVVRFENRQRPAGTTRVREPEHARSRAGTPGTCCMADLQEKRDRGCPAVYASTAPEPPW
jgi:hypothetical protein